MKPFSVSVNKRLTGIPAYALAAAAVSGAWLVRFLLDDRLGDASPYLPFFLAVVLTVQFTGAGPSVAAVIASVVLSDWFFVPPRQAIGFHNTAQWVSATFFIVASAFAGLFAGAARAAADRQREAVEEASSIRRRLETLVAALPAAVLFSKDASARKILANPAAMAQFELSSVNPMQTAALNELVSNRVRFFKDGEELSLAQLPLQLAVAEKKAVGPVELEVLLQSGRRWCAETIAAPILDDTGAVTGGVAAAFDITHRKEAEETLRRQQEQLRLVHQRLTSHIENSPLAVIEFDPALRLTFWSRGAAEMFGWQAAEVMGKCMWDLPWIFEEDRAKVESVSAALLHRQQPRTVSPNRNLRKDGAVIWSEWYNSSIMDESGEVSSIFSLVLDVTERVAAETSLQESEERFRAMADGTPVMLWVHDAEGNLRFVNRSLRAFFGSSLERAHESEWRTLIHPEDAPHYVDTFHACTRERMPFRTRIRVRRHDGEWRWIEVTGEPRLSGAGEFLGLAGSSVDITDRVDFMAELERQVEQRTLALRETTNQLNSLCYTIAHDLRAPLRAQLGFAAILNDEFGEALGAEGKAYLQRIKDSAERQSHLILDLLAHLSISRSDLPLEETRLRQAVEQARAELEAEITRKEATLEIGAIEDTVAANGASLHVVLNNLLSNALKFVPSHRKPRIRLWTERIDGRVRIWVEDNGIGIDPCYRGKLFQVFQRLHSTTEYPGTGIGLAIVKQAVLRMGGTVGFQSEPGEGSRFWVELKACSAPDSETMHDPRSG